MSTRYFYDTQTDPPLLLRRTRDSSGILDEAFLRAGWQRTTLIIDSGAGHNDWVDDTSESRARQKTPAAFK